MVCVQSFAIPECFDLKMGDNALLFSNIKALNKGCILLDVDFEYPRVCNLIQGVLLWHLISIFKALEPQ